MAGTPGSDAYPPIGATVDVTVRGLVHRHLVDDRPEFLMVYGTVLVTETGREVRIRDHGEARYQIVAPEGWPPQAGDAWQDAKGLTWFFYLSEHGHRQSELHARNSVGGYVCEQVASAILALGPLKLLLRAGNPWLAEASRA